MITEVRRFKRIFLMLGIIFLILFNINVSFAGTVVVKPGQFDHFTLQMPDKIIAGENFIIKVQVYDANNNLITNFSETGKEFRVYIDGFATVQPSVLNAASFSGGSANVSIISQKAEKLTFSIRESGGTVPVISRELTVMPNKLDHFVLQAPSEVTAGNSFDVRVIAKDLFENTVNDLDIGRNIKVTSSGTSTVRMLGNETFDFSNGTAVVRFVSEMTGDVVIEMHEFSTGSRGQTAAVSINPASLSYFKMQSQKSVTAGEPFEILIAAYDAFDNVVTNYSSVGSGVELTTTGKSKLEPSFIGSSEFKEGQVVIRATYEKAETIQVVARERNRQQTGGTADIVVENANPDHFVVVTPDTAVSGQRFKVKIEAYDRFNNIVRNFNIAGNDIILSTTGTGSISPSKISPSQFVNGIAMVDVMYDKAESFLISARMAVERTPGRVSLEEQKVPKSVAPRKEIKKTQKKSPPKSQAVERAPEDIIPKESRTELPPSEPEVKQEKKIKEPVRKTEKPAAPVITKKEPATKIAPPEKKAAAEPKQPPVELAKKEPPKVEAPSEIFMVSNISIIEAKNKAMLVINITNPNGNLNYSDEIESRYGKEWLKLTMNPAHYKTERAFKFSSDFIGEVLLEEDKDKKNVLSIFIELIPAGVKFDIARVKNTLIVTLARP